MRCTECGTENRDRARFCVKCGVALFLACPQCAAELPYGAVFCDSCGAAVGAPPLDPLAETLKRLAPKEYAERLLAACGQVGHERRTVTILFCDIKGSSAIASKLDPEEVLDIVNGAFECLIPPVFRYEGTLTQLMGDAILAFFGAPIAHDDDPERACRAALDIIERAKEYATQLERERGISGFDVRVGINTGPVVVGEVGTDLRVAYTAVGDTINMAARMEQSADPGTALVTEETYRLVSSLFDIKSIGPIEVKGHEAPMPAYRILSPKAVGKVRGLSGLTSPLVGRDTEIGELQEAVARLRAGVGGIVTVVGEAGIGKSRLVAEARKDADASRVQWVEGRCLSYGTSIAYLLWLDVLRSLLGVTEETTPSAVREGLREQCRLLCSERFDQVYPYLARLMSLPLEPDIEATLGRMEGEQLRTGTFGAVETLVECAARQHPLVLVCEDMHWADPTSLQLLERVLVLVDRVALLIVSVFRPERQKGCWRIKEIAARVYPHRHSDLWLLPLSGQESEALLGNLMGEAFQTKRLGARILRQAEGNPFYLEEILRSLLKTGAVCRGETGDWKLSQGVDDISMPETLQGVIRSRIDSLGEEAKRVLQLAAVIGRIVPYRILADITRGEGQLQEHLITLQREGMIRERARLPEPEYIFKHELTKEAAYDGVLKRDRRILHRRVAETLERLHSDRVEEYVEILAEHWDKANEPERALGYLIRAGDRARRLGASLEAIGFYDRALAKVESLQPDRRAGELRSLHERLADVYLLNLSRHDKALEHYTAFLAVAESDEDSARAGRKIAVLHQLQGRLQQAEECYQTALSRLSSRPHSEEASAIHCGLAYLLWARNELEAAGQHAAEGLRIAQLGKDTKALADANRATATVAYARGDFASACTHLERCLELYRNLGDLPRIAQTCNNLGEIYRILGQMARALEHLDEGLALAKRIGDTRDEAHLLGTKAELLLDQGRWDASIELLERALPLAEESGVAPGIIEVHLFLGVANEGAGRLENALSHLRAAEQFSEETQYSRFAPRVYLGLADISAKQGDIRASRRLLQMARDAAGFEPPDGFLGLLHRCQGHLHACCGDWDAAIENIEKALRFLRRENSRSEIAKTCLILGKAYESRDRENDRGRAREQFIAAQSIFRELEAHGYLTEVNACVERAESK